MHQSNNKSSLKKGKIYGIKTGYVQTISFVVIMRMINEMRRVLRKLRLNVCIFW